MAADKKRTGNKKTRKKSRKASRASNPPEQWPPTGGSKLASVDVSVELEISRVLDDLEESVMRGQLDETEKITDKLWTHRKLLPQVIVDRLIAGKSKFPAVEFDTLIGFGGQKARSHLKTIADSPSAEDIVRFGARRRMGWPERGEVKARLAFLNSLRAPESTLVEATRQGTALWPPDGEILADVVGYLEASSPEFALRVVAQGVRDIEADAYAWLMRPLLHSRYPTVQKAALAQLVGTDVQASAGAIRRLARTASDPEVRMEAEAAARRSQFRVVAGRKGARDNYQEFPPVDTLWASPIDGAGAQVLLLMRRWMPGFHLVADVLHKDSWGVKEAFGFHHMPEAEGAEMVEEFSEDGVGLVRVDVSLGRGILDAAVEANDATRHRIPPTFEIWEPLFHDAYPPPAEERVETPALDDKPFAGRRDLYVRSDELLDHPFFHSWFFNPEDIGPLLSKVPPPTKKTGIGDAQLVPLVGLLVDDRTRHLLRRRLGRQARLLELKGDTEERDLALAAAAALSDDRKDQLGKHPLLRQMVLNSISNLFQGFLFY